MKNNLWFILTCVLMYFIGYNMNDIALSVPKYRVAVVDIPTVLAQSEALKNLNKNHDKKLEELNVLISKAQNDLLNEHDKNKLLKKESDYRQEIETKKKAIDKEYSQNLEDITKNIKSIVNKEAQKSKYNLVLPTGIVISGGVDITQKVAQAIK